MPVDFLKQRKRQKYLVPIVLAVIAVSAIVLWFGYFRKGKQPSPSVESPTAPALREIKIDFSVLEKPFLKELQPFVEISPFEGEKGRSNPFKPY